MPNLSDYVQFAKLSKTFLTWGDKERKAIFQSIKRLDALFMQANAGTK